MIQRIAALVSIGQHPNSGAARHCRNDSLAMSVGLNLAESESAQMQVLHAGDAQNPALADYLALGAPQIEVIETETDIVENLAENLENTDLILTGSRAESGDASGLLPYLLAAKLNVPLVANALEIKLVADGIEILQFLPKGKRRLVNVQLPAVVVVHPLADVDLHYAFAQKIAGKIVALPALKSTNTGKIEEQTKRVNRKPIKLKAPEHKSGHERLLAAISSENKGGAVVNEGNSVEKAQVILDYLREHRLVDF
jgi:electron transfer flavoprotein beta subunit